MKQEILTKLKSAEADTARRVEAAREKAAELVRAARTRADEVRRQAQEDGRRDQEAAVQAERSKLAHERERLLAEGRAKEERLRTSYKKDADAHVKKVVDAFARSLDA